MTQTTHRSDQDIQATVSEELLSTPSVDTHLVVARVSGVQAVANELQVRVLPTPGTDDADIAQTAGRLLGWAVDVPSGTVKAEVHDHVITLSGHVT